jgi:hypothetical protein
MQKSIRREIALSLRLLNFFLLSLNFFPSVIYLSLEFENAIYETERASLEISDQCILKSFQNICKALREVEKKFAELKTDQ